MRLPVPSRGFWGALALVGLGVVLVGLAFPPLPAPAYKGRPVEEWFEHLIDFEPAEAFAEMGTNAVPFLRTRLAKRDEVRNKLVGWLRRATPKQWASKLPQPTWAEGERKDAAFALWWMGPDTALPERDLRRALENDSENVRSYAAIMLGERGLADDALLGFCRQCLQNTNRTEEALRLLTATPALVPRMDRDELLRACQAGDFAGFACARFYEITHDRVFLERLRLLAADPGDSKEACFNNFEDWWLTGEGSEGLCALYAGDENAFDNPALVCASDVLQELSDAALRQPPGSAPSKDREARLRELIATLSVLQDEWIARVGTNQSSLNDSLVEVEILSNLPSVNPAVVPALRRCLREREFLGRLHAARALGRVGPAAALAIPDLRRMLRSECSLDRIGAAEALWRIERRQEQVLPVLEACLNAPGARVRGTAGRALLVVECDAPGSLSPELRHKAQMAFELSSVPSVMGILIRLRL